jgi:hypothetical protein
MSRHLSVNLDGSLQVRDTDDAKPSRLLRNRAIEGWYEFRDPIYGGSETACRIRRYKQARRGPRRAVVVSPHDEAWTRVRARDPDAVVRIARAALSEIVSLADGPSPATQTINTWAHLMADDD